MVHGAFARRGFQLKKVKMESSFRISGIRFLKNCILVKNVTFAVDGVPWGPSTRHSGTGHKFIAVDVLLVGIE